MKNEEEIEIKLLNASQLIAIDMWIGSREFIAAQPHAIFSHPAGGHLDPTEDNRIVFKEIAARLRAKAEQYENHAARCSR